MAGSYGDAEFSGVHGSGVPEMMNGFAAAVNGFFGAFAFVMRHRMGWLFLMPALLWILLSVGLFTVLAGPADRLAAWAIARTGMELADMDDGLWRNLLALLDGAREILVIIVVKIAIAYLLYTLGKYVVLILLSPILAYASERTEEIITGRRYPFELLRLLKDALRGSLIAMRNGIIELLLSAVVWMITLLLPFSVPLSVAALFIISAYFYGFSMFDYIFERRRMKVGESVQAINQRVHLVLVNGALFSLLMKIPLLGMTFAPVMAAVGAVRAMENDPLFRSEAVTTT
jgi:CysZ protein